MEYELEKYSNQICRNFYLSYLGLNRVKIKDRESLRRLGQLVYESEDLISDYELLNIIILNYSVDPKLFVLGTNIRNKISYLYLVLHSTMVRIRVLDNQINSLQIFLPGKIIININEFKIDFYLDFFYPFIQKEALKEGIELNYESKKENITYISNFLIED